MTANGNVSCLLLAVNAKYSHTSLAVRYLREASSDLCKIDMLEMTINNKLSDILGCVYDRQPDILGIACYIWNIELVKQLLPLVPKVLPTVKIICGGPEVSYKQALFLEHFPMVDYVVSGEGEEAWRSLLYSLCHQGEAADIPGVSRRDAAGQIYTSEPVAVQQMEHLPFPYRQSEMADLKERILYYESSRGCPFSCAYCLSCATKGVRFLPLERTIRELAFFISCDVRQVKFVDRTFNTNKQHFLPIWQFLSRQYCRTNFHFEIAADYLDAEALEVLSSMPRGRIQLEIGIQSCNDQTLQAVRRINHWDKLASNIRRLISFGNIHVHIDLIIGLPYEGMDSLQYSFDEMYALGADMLQIGFLKFLQGAGMMEQIEQGDYKYMDNAPYEVLSNKWLSFAEIKKLHVVEDVFSLYDNAGRCQRAIKYVIGIYEHGSAFSFYSKLADYWQEQDFVLAGQKEIALYERLLAFCGMSYGSECQPAIDMLLRFDALLAGSAKALRPPALAWSGKSERFRQKEQDFWHQKAADRYCGRQEFVRWRTWKQRYHIEGFPFQLTLLLGKKDKGQIWVLFDLEDGTYREIAGKDFCSAGL